MMNRMTGRMRLLLRAFLALVALIVAFSSTANAIRGWPVGQLPAFFLQERMAKVDMVCAGTFEGTSRQVASPVEWEASAGPMLRDDTRVATFRVDHVIKGSLDMTGEGLEVLYLPILPPPVGAGRYARKKYPPDLLQRVGTRRCLLQLLKREDGTWQARFGGDSYMVLGAKPEAADWAKLTEWQRLEQEFASAILDPDPVVAGHAIASATKMQSPAAGPVLTAALRKRQAGEPEWLARMATTGLVGIGDLDTIYDLPQTLHQWKAKPVTYPLWVAWGMTDAISRLTSRNAVPALVELSRDSQRWVRRSATLALRQIGGNDTKAALADRLDDEDPEIRYHAAIGLGNGLKPRDVGAKDWTDWLPAANIYEKDPEKVLNNWRRWWQEKGKAKYPSVEQVLKKAERFRRERPWAREAEPQE